MALELQHTIGDTSYLSLPSTIVFMRLICWALALVKSQALFTMATTYGVNSSAIMSSRQGSLWVLVNWNASCSIDLRNPSCSAPEQTHYEIPLTGRGATDGLLAQPILHTNQATDKVFESSAWWLLLYCIWRCHTSLPIDMNNGRLISLFMLCTSWWHLKGTVASLCFQ